MSKCYLLGAGASYGHDDRLAHKERPPLGSSLFKAGWERGILKWRDFRPLVRKIAEYNNIEKHHMDMEPSDLWMEDTEAFLSYLNEEWQRENQDIEVEERTHTWDDKTLEYETIKETDTEGADQYTKEYKIPLSISYYYIYELFRQQCINYQPHGDNYDLMTRSLHDSPDSVITLNYDTFLEKALSARGTDYHYHEVDEHKNSIPLLKLHGSITWINKLPVSVANANNFPTKVQHTHGSSSQAYIDGVSTLWVDQYTYRGLAYSLEAVFEPGIIPPFDKHKNYQKTRVYDALWKYAQDNIKNAAEIVIIGCSLNTSDSKLRALLENNVDSDTSFTIVTPSPQLIVDKLDMVLEEPNISQRVEGDEPFSEYAEIAF